MGRDRLMACRARHRHLFPSSLLTSRPPAAVCCYESAVSARVHSKFCWVTAAWLQAPALATQCRVMLMLMVWPLVGCMPLVTKDPWNAVSRDVYTCKGRPVSGSL
jgi:hypothetical protein